MRTSAAQTPSAMKKPERDQDCRVHRAERDAQLVRRRDEGIVVPVAIEQVGKEQPAEEHDFGQQEEPHAEGSGLALLLLRLEVMTVLRKRDVVMLLCHEYRVLLRSCYPTVVTSCSVL